MAIFLRHKARGELLHSLSPPHTSSNAFKRHLKPSLPRGQGLSFHSLQPHHDISTCTSQPQHGAQGVCNIRIPLYLPKIPYVERQQPHDSLTPPLGIRDVEAAASPLALLSTMSLATSARPLKATLQKHLLRWISEPLPCTGGCA